MPKRPPTYAATPTAGSVTDAPPSAVKQEFARRLQHALAEKGWNQSELARQASLHMGEGQVSRDRISAYVNAVSLPLAAHLSAIAKALRKKPEELLPVGDLNAKRRNAQQPGLHFSSAVEHGYSWVQVNAKLPTEHALEIARIVNEYAVHS